MAKVGKALTSQMDAEFEMEVARLMHPDDRSKVKASKAGFKPEGNVRTRLMEKISGEHIGGFTAPFNPIGKAIAIDPTADTFAHEFTHRANPFMSEQKVLERLAVQNPNNAGFVTMARPGGAETEPFRKLLLEKRRKGEKEGKIEKNKERDAGVNINLMNAFKSGRFPFDESIESIHQKQREFVMNPQDSN